MAGPAARRDSERNDALYFLALDIRDGRKPGMYLPKIRSLALRGHPGAMIELADWLTTDGGDPGHARDHFGSASLYRRAFRKGDARAAFNLAMTCFNRNDLAGYRTWLGRAARAGDTEAARQAACFETRLSHPVAARVRRLRPHHRRDEFPWGQ